MVRQRKFVRKPVRAHTPTFAKSVVTPPLVVPDGFITSCVPPTPWPGTHTKEVCFIGRSNVGKSSLLNAVMRFKTAHTSRVPGRTRTVNYYQWQGRVLVDLPGYGYAKASRGAKSLIFKTLNAYFLSATRLKGVFLLLDARHGITHLDQKVLDYLQKTKHPYFLVATKQDKTSQSQRALLRQQATQMNKKILLVSARTRFHLQELQDLVRSVL